MNPEIEVIGLQPDDGASIPGIRRWPKEYLPGIYTHERVDRIIDMGQQEAETTMRALARQEGIFVACRPVVRWPVHSGYPISWKMLSLWQ